MMLVIRGPAKVSLIWVAICCAQQGQVEGDVCRLQHWQHSVVAYKEVPHCEQSPFCAHCPQTALKTAEVSPMVNAEVEFIEMWAHVPIA